MTFLVYQLHMFVSMLTSDLDLFVQLITHHVGSKCFMRIFGMSGVTNTILFDAVIKRFAKIMTHERGYVWRLRS